MACCADMLACLDCSVLSASTFAPKNSFPAFVASPVFNSPVCAPVFVAIFERDCKSNPPSACCSASC